MDNATTQSKEALLEPALPGSVTFEENILVPLQNNYLYKESKECFTYKSAHLINNAALQKQYAAFRADKQENGYSEQELEESYGFLLFDDIDKAKKVGETGLLVGQAKCTTLGDSSKGVYISKYSDCLDLKRWYDGKTGYIVLVKLTKGKVKEVTDNYTQNFTPPTPRFDCHVSEQLGAVTTTTSSFLAFERTQYYLYELAETGKVEPCPRQACPLAIVAFSYGATAAISGSEEQSQAKKVFRYKPWIGQLKIESTVYDVGLQSVSGAWFPAKLPKMVKIDRAIGVSELKRTLPWEIFETCLVGEVCIDGRCFNLYDVVSSKAKNDLAQITQELKEKDMALVIPLDDSGFLILLHSSHLFSYEDARSGKAAVLQGMFIFPDSRAVPRDTKSSLAKHNVSADIIQTIPAINYAEAEMEKCPPNQQGAPHTTLEKHLQNYATLIQPGLLDAPTREASMFPDQYDVPSGFTLISPKWSQETGTRLKSYFEEPCGFTVPVVRALELLAAGRQQRSDEHDDDVYYYISSPEEVPPAPVDGAMVVMEQAEASGDGQGTSGMALENNDKGKHLSAEQSQPALQEGLGTLGTAVVKVANSVPEYPASTVSPKLGDVPTENCVTVGIDAKKSTKETLIKTSSTQSLKEGTAVGGGLEDNIHSEKTMADNKVDWRSRPKRRGRNRKMHWKALQVKKEVQKELTLPTSSSPLILPVNSTESMMDKKEQPKLDSLTANDINQRPHLSSRGRGHRRRGVSRNLIDTRKEQAPFESTAVSTSMPAETIDDQDEKMYSGTDKKRDWRSLPRRKRLWNTDATLKRCLRSYAIKTDNDDSICEESLTRGPKRKLEGFSQRDRYGLKNIITTCGRVFVPHGSDVVSEDVDSSNVCETSIDTKAEVISSVENKSSKIVESSEVFPSKVEVVNEGQVSPESPSKDKPSVQIVTPIAVVDKQNKSSPPEIDKIQQPTTSALNEAESLQHNIKDNCITAQADKTTSPPRVPDQSTSLSKVASPEKAKRKGKRPVYSAISISKLKTVLRRGKLSKSLSSGGDGKSESEPESKKGKSENIMDYISNKQLIDNGLQPVNDGEQHSLLSHGGQETMTTLPVAWKGLIRKASKENGPPNFHTSVPCKIVKQADEQLMSSLIGEGVGRISSDAKGCTEKLNMGATLPSDALSLLADLALSASNSKTLSDLQARHGQEMPAGIKASANPESVLHALLQCPSTRLKLPPRSPFPEGLIVTGELHLEISKEHSYSQPTSLLSGLSGTQVYPAPVESPLALKTGLHLNLPVTTAMPFCQKGVKTEWKSLIPPNGALPPNSKTKMRRSKIFRDRHIVEKKESLEVVRIWRETYEFKYDSRFTNDSLDKTVMRALHGKWNFDIEDTPEEVHLIFHMWIGLFYSKSTSRLFHLENSTALSKGENNMDVKDKQDVDPMKTMTSLNVKLNLKEDLPKAMPLPSDILDLSVKNCVVNSNGDSQAQSRGDGTVSHTQVASHEMEPNRSLSGPSISKVTALMDHRSAMDILDGNVGSDKDDDIDDENDIIADCSYNQLLEGNSAYSQLCEQASNMKISMQPQMQLQKSANIYKKVAPMRITSFTYKDIGVFHQVIKQSAFSKCSGLVSYRKSFDQCLMAKNVVYVQQKAEDMSKNSEKGASFEACETQNVQVFVGDENVDKTSEFTNADGMPALVLEESDSETNSSAKVIQKGEDNQDGGLTLVEENVTSKSLNGDALSVAEQNNSNADLNDHTDKYASCADELKDKLLPETRVEEQNETMNEMDDSNVVNVSPRSVEEIVGERGERCEKIEEGQSKSNENSTAMVEPDELAVDLIENTDIVDMEFSDDDLDDNPAIVAYELNTSSVNSFVSETINSDVKNDQNETQTEQSVKANPGNDVCEEHDVSYSGDGTSVSCQILSVEEKTTSASNSDTVEVMQSEKESMTLEQNIEVQKEALELCENESTHNSFVLKTINSDVNTDKNETQTEQPVKANPEDDVCKEHDVSYSGDGTLVSCQILSVEEKTTSASNSDSVEVTQSEKENVTLEQNIEVQEEALELCENESTPTHDSFVLETINSDVKTDQNETQIEQPVKANPEDDVCEEHDVSYSGDGTSVSCQLLSVEVKTTSASNSDTVEVTQCEKENVTLEQNIEVQEEALELCENESTPTNNSFVLETINSDVKTDQNETQTEQPVKANPGDDVCEEHDVSYLGDGTSVSCQLLSVEEKTTSASNSDSVEVTQSEKENVTLEQNIEVQEEALELCENKLKPTHNTESRKLEVSQEDGEIDKCDVDETFNGNDDESQTSYSCEDEAQDTHQKCQSPQISASSPNSTSNSCEQTVASQALSDGEINSTSSTPTRDEVSYDPEISENGSEVSDFSKSSNRNLHSTNNTDQEVSPSSQEHCEKKTSEELGWIKSKYAPTMSPREKKDIQFKNNLCSTSQQKDEQITITESTSQHDSELSYSNYDVDKAHRSYDPSDEHLQWFYCKTDKSGHYFDEDYLFDADYSDVSYPMYNPEISEDSYETKMMGCWMKKNYKSESRSASDDANRRGDSFRCQTKVTYNPQYATNNLEVEQIPNKRSRTDKFTDIENAEWNEEDSLSCTVDYSVRKTSFHTTKPTRTVTVNSLSRGRKSKQRFDWRRYFRREATWDDCEGSKKFDIPPSSLVSVLDKKGNRVTFDKSPALKPPVDLNRMTIRPEDSSKIHLSTGKMDLIQSAVDLEYLIFSEQLNCILKESRSSLRSRRRRSDTEHGTFPVKARFVEGSNDVESASLAELKIKVDLSDRKRIKRKRRHFCDTGSKTTEHESGLTDRTVPGQTEAIKSKWDLDSQQPGFSGSVRKDALDNLHDNLCFTVKQECNVKCRFFILVTSADNFFNETRNLLMMEGHIPVESDVFDLSHPLLIVLRNEDIAEHISEVPHLLELKKSSNVLFAGIDRPNDVVNFTHKELFANGGFIVFDELAFDTLTLDNMKKVVGILEELDKKGKWKWFLHYKNRRKLQESMRFSQEARKKQRFIDCCQEAGIVEILPFHDCDVTSQGQPDNHFCLTHLQIQNTSVRLPVFITDTSSDAYEKNGILTMDINTFSRFLTKDSCYVS